MKLFQSLRGKLILTYTLVTVLALLALELVVIVALFLSTFVNSQNERAYVSDVVYVLYPQASTYLQPGAENIPGLQTWLEKTYENGYASLAPQDTFDSPAAPIEKDDPIYVLDPTGKVLAQAPSGRNSLVGQQYTPPNIDLGQKVVQNALNKRFDTLALYTIKPDGNYFVAFPVTQGSRDSQLVGVIVLTVQPPPSTTLQLYSIWPRLISLGPIVIFTLLGTGMVLLVMVAPFAALFGLIMSRGLTKRLATLTTAADAWSEGNFVALPYDKSKDEISHLGMRMRNMAERLQTLLQTRQELATLEERNRLARELHDTIKQQNFAVLMQIRTTRNLLKDNPGAAEEHLAEAEGLVKASQQELGLMISELGPAALQGHGLVEALRSYTETWSQQVQIPINLQVENERRLPLEIEQGLFRVVQESLSNVARHSHASLVNIHLQFEPDQFTLHIQDNGIGFDMQAQQKPGFGMNSMQERICNLNGTLQIESQPGEGTVLIACVPVGAARL